MVKKIIVASRNPVKIKAVGLGFQKMFPEIEWQVEGLTVPSGVRDQPMSNAETLQGAQQRSSNAQARYPDADFWAGIEGGIEFDAQDMNAFAWIVIQNREALGKAKTGSFFLPPAVAQLVKEGKELGEADDLVFGQSNSKQANGAVGLLTNNILDRTQLYVDGVALALIPFKNPSLYFQT